MNKQEQAAALSAENEAQAKLLAQGLITDEEYAVSAKAYFHKLHLLLGTRNTPKQNLKMRRLLSDNE